MTDLIIGITIGLIFGFMIGAIAVMKISDRRIGEYLTDMSTAFRSIG